MSHPHDPFRLDPVEVREFERKSAEVGRTTALMLRAIGEQLTRELKAIGDLHRADLARRRTATVSEGPTETPLRPLLPASSSSTGEPAPRYLPRELRRRSTMRSQGVGDSTPAAGSRAVPAGRQRRPEGSAIREVSQSPDHARDRVADRKERARLPFQARTGCVQGPPCLLLQALQRTAPGAGAPQPYIDQSPWCSLGSANGHRWFRCENRHACLEAHRLSHLSEKTPEKRRSRAVLVALAAFVAGDMIFGRRA